MPDYSNSYPKDPSWQPQYSNGINAEQLASKIGMTTQQLLSKTINTSHSDLTIKIWDYVVLALFLMISASIGLYFAYEARQKMKKKQVGKYEGKDLDLDEVDQDVEDYLMAGKQLSAFPVALSLTASFMSALTVLGTPREFYNYGMMFYYSALCYLLVTLLIAYIFTPIVYPLKVNTAYEYFTVRFKDHKVEKLASISYLITTFAYMGVVTYAPALALQQVTKINLWLAAYLTALLCTVYTTLGGLKAVIWTDVFQTCVIMTGFVSIITTGSIEFEGMGKILIINKEAGRAIFDDFRLDPTIRTTFWSVVFGGTFGIWGSVYTSQSMVQRYLSCKSLKTVQKACWINFVGLLIILILAGFTGHTAYAYFQYCDPKAANFIEQSDQLIPYLSVKILENMPGLSGLYIAGVYAGTLSTISSGINSASTVILRDFIKPNIESGGCYSNSIISRTNETILSKIIVLLCGILTMVIAYLASITGNNVLVAGMSALGTFGGPVLGSFLLCFTNPWADSFTTVISFIIGFFNATFCFAGIFINGRNAPVMPWEKNTQVQETCLCNIDDPFNSLDFNGTVGACLGNKPYLDIFQQNKPDRGFFEWIWHISYWDLGFVGSLSVYIIGWFMTFIRIKIMGKTIERAEDRTLLWFLRNKKKMDN